jgi:hypothetical protein
MTARKLCVYCLAGAWLWILPKKVIRIKVAARCGRAHIAHDLDGLAEHIRARARDTRILARKAVPEGIHAAVDERLDALMNEIAAERIRVEDGPALRILG